MARKTPKRKAIQAEKRKAAMLAEPKRRVTILTDRPMAATLAVMMAAMQMQKDQPHD